MAYLPGSMPSNSIPSSTTNSSFIADRERPNLVNDDNCSNALSAGNLEILSRISMVNKTRIDEVLELVDLDRRAEDKVHTYSYGMKQRLGIAQTLLHDPQIIILDEPNNGLDPIGIDDMGKLIKKLKHEGKTVCLSTHNLKDVEDICTDFTVFKNGRNSSATSMEEQLKKSNKWLINTKNAKNLENKLKESDLFKIIDVFDKKILIESNSNNTIKDLNELLKDLEIYKISKESNLIEYFND